VDTEVTMMQLRAQPGEYFYHRVYKHDETIIVTHMGRPIAQICPLDVTEITGDGKIIGPAPITKGRPELLR